MKMKHWKNEDGSIKLINGDCLEVMDKLIAEGVVVDAIITDPPYGVNFKNDFYDDSFSNVSKNIDKFNLFAHIGH